MSHLDRQANGFVNRRSPVQSRALAQRQAKNRSAAATRTAALAALARADLALLAGETSLRDAAALRALAERRAS